MKKGILEREKPRLKLGVMGAVSHGNRSLTAAIEKTLAKHKNYNSGDIYEALVSSDQESAKHTVIAESLIEARKMLEDKYGKGTVFSLWNRQQASKPRQK